MSGCDSKDSSQALKPDAGALPIGTPTSTDGKHSNPSSGTKTGSPIVSAPKLGGGQSAGLKPLSPANGIPVSNPVGDAEALTPVQRKLDPNIVSALKQGGVRTEDGIPMPSRGSFPIQTEGRVLVDLDAVVTEELLDHVVSMGGKVISSSAADHAVRAMIPFAQLETLAVRPDIKFISPGTMSDTSQALKARGTTEAKP